MDEFDIFWERHFGVVASMFERRLLAQVMTTIEPGDPLLVVTAMLIRQLYVSLGETEKALQFGPALSDRVAGLEASMGNITTTLAAILRETKRLERGFGMLNAHVIDRERSMRERLEKRAAAIIGATGRPCHESSGLWSPSSLVLSRSQSGRLG